MRYLFIMIILFSLTSQTYAKEAYQLRAQMLRTGKHLTLRYETLTNRELAWLERKQILIANFKKKHKAESRMADASSYAKQRFKKRKGEFYSSLQAREDEIVKERASIYEELELLKVKFSHRYGVGMSKKEMFDGKAPRIKNKKRKIRLLREYIHSTKSWKACLKQVEGFDDKRMNLEMRTNISMKKYNTLSLKLDKKIEKNFSALNRYEEKSMGALNLYALDYGYSIPDEAAAKTLLYNIEKSR